MKRHISFSTQIARSVKVLLFMLLCGINVFGQTATPNAVINFPSHICSGQATTLNLNNSIQVNNPKFSLYHHATTIIPNGNCPNGCNFDDIFQFSSFRPADTIRSTEDINFVLLNMEHSYIGELLIEVICPNQQSATLLRYNRFEISNDCESTINNSNSGWQEGTTTVSRVISWDILTPTPMRLIRVKPLAMGRTTLARDGATAGRTIPDTIMLLMMG